MFAPSLNRAPLLDVTMARSDPARSISDIFPMVKFAFSPAVLSFCRTNTYDMAFQNTVEPLISKQPKYQSVKVVVQVRWSFREFQSYLHLNVSIINHCNECVSL